MTCTNCESSVRKSLMSVAGVEDVVIKREEEELTITANTNIPLNDLQKSLPSKYKISPLEETVLVSTIPKGEPESKLKQLKPLFLILGYILIASILLHYKNWNLQEAMLDFMGLFLLVFSFFKMLDIKGFASTFQMYDPIAKRVPPYALIYPFIESALALMFFFRWNLSIALILTIVVLGFTTIGVVKVLMDKKSIKCACLGTALNLPMTEATFIENALMLVMAFTMLFSIG